MERHIKWNEIIDRVKKLDQTKKYYGVPRGGQYISAMLNPVDTPNEADIIIDDLIDSGKTKLDYQKYNLPFIGLFDKQKEIELKDQWLVFPWEANESPIEDNIIRISAIFLICSFINIKVRINFTCGLINTTSTSFMYTKSRYTT